MIIELDASEIIAFYVDKTNQDQIDIKFDRIRAIAKQMERSNPTILTSCDMMSISDFQSNFTNNVIITENHVCIKGINSIRKSISCYLPSESIIKKLNELDEY